MAGIGRLWAIGLGIEATRWTQAPAQVWIGKESGSLNPAIESATDWSWYWVIDAVADSFTTKNSSTLNLQGIVKEDSIGFLMLLALWKVTKVYWVTGTPSGWTPARWDVESGGWVLKKIITVGTTTVYFFDKAVTWSITNGTWTMTATALSWVYGHFFEVKQDNQHPSATIYDDDIVAWSYAPYCMINNFELSCEVGDYMKFTAEFMWKQIQTASAQTPAYVSEKWFTASMSWVRFANDEAWLNGASEQCVQNFRLSIAKNLAEIQCFGETDITDIYNQQFGIEWDFEAVYESTTLRDYVLNSDKKAVRFYAVNKNAPALATGIYPSIYVDLMKAGFSSWTKSDSNDEIISQTMWFTGQYSTNDSTSIEILLLNWNSVGY